jgi:hypothetical protein
LTAKARMAPTAIRKTLAPMPIENLRLTRLRPKNDPLRPDELSAVKGDLPVLARLVTPGGAAPPDRPTQHGHFA